jgi:hypothetical protein
VDRFPLGEQEAEWLSGAIAKPTARTVPGGAPTFHRGPSALIELDAEETK